MRKRFPGHVSDSQLTGSLFVSTTVESCSLCCRKKTQGLQSLQMFWNNAALDLLRLRARDSSDSDFVVCSFTMDSDLSLSVPHPPRG